MTSKSILALPPELVENILISIAAFSNHVKPVQTRPFFAHWGVTWDRGSYLCTATALNPADIPAPLNRDALLPLVSAKAVHVKNAPRAHAVYLPAAASHVESHVFARDPSPAVFARVGESYLEYVGNVNGDQGSVRVIFEMYRLSGRIASRMRKATALELARGHNGRLDGDAAEGSQNQWADERKSRIQFGYDADEAAHGWWREGGERLLQQAAAGGKVNGDRDLGENWKASP
ncbi:hypothetical protein GSI_12381 [Ganoderma sinense ZZ0214-1]|uniref:Uncharacterized protein n=1 Tax=Ganoderma sinense ZZ0214-1 TaxID=1077348 RepID=A0A2G8RVL0_9APHY|nr:hypothetical protein GSI_12381 [Ganoderma sinense ZZ0214-1]